jgi:DNA gyrase subunit A
MGVRTIPTNERNGNVVGLALVTNESSVLLIDGSGKIIRLKPEEIRTMGRQAQGVRLIRLDDDQKVGAVFAFVEEPSDVQLDDQLDTPSDSQSSHIENVSPEATPELTMDEAEPIEN